MSDQHIDIDAATPGWHSTVTLDPNTTYVIVPDAASRFIIALDGLEHNYHGAGPISGKFVNLSGVVQLGGLAVLVRHNQPQGGESDEVLAFPAGKYFAVVSIGPAGGTMSFAIASAIGSLPNPIAADLGDSFPPSTASGSCGVDVFPFDQPHALLFGALLNGYMAAGPEKFQAVATTCGVQVAAGAIIGGAAGSLGGPASAAAWALAGAAAVALTSDACADLAHDVIQACEKAINQMGQPLPEGGEGSGEGVGGVAGGSLGGGTDTGGPTGAGGTGQQGPGDDAPPDEGPGNEGPPDDHDEGDDHGGGEEHSGGQEHRGEALIGGGLAPILPKTKDARVTKCRNKLIDVAKNQGLITYGDLATYLRVPVESVKSYLIPVSAEERGAGRPDLTFVVVWGSMELARFGRGSKPHAALTGGLRRPDDPKTYSEELARVYSHWQQQEKGIHCRTNG